MASYREFNFIVIGFLLKSSAFVLELFQYEIAVDYVARTIRTVGVYYVDPQYSMYETSGVEVGEPCIGYGIMSFFFAIIVSYPGMNKAKLWFIPMGLFIIYFINIVRISLLAIMIKYQTEVWELNHKFIFKITVYIIIFLLWMYWLRLASKKKITSL